jgi:hypothetical protein
MKNLLRFLPFLFWFFFSSALTKAQILNSLVNHYAVVTAPANINIGTQTITVDDATPFGVGDLAVIIQMKGAEVITTAGETYGNVTNINNAGNYEIVKVAAKSGNNITFVSCLSKAYTVSGLVQLVRMPTYTGNQTVSVGGTISAIKVHSRGYGYTTPPAVTIAAPTGPVAQRVQATAVAVLDAFGQVAAIRITNPGGGYIVNPAVTIASPPAPYNHASFRATAVAHRGLTCMPWDGEKGGVLAINVEGNLILNDSINASGMGFRGGFMGSSGSTSFGSGCVTSDNLDFGPLPPYATHDNGTGAGARFAQSACKGEGIADFQTTHYRGKGRWSNGGGAGLRGEAGGGGGGNYGAGGIGGRHGSAAIFGCTSANGSGRGAFGLSSFGYDFFNNDRIFLGGGGGGGHAYNSTYNSAANNHGGRPGGGIIIISAQQIIGNGYGIKASGDNAPQIAGDGTSGGGGGGVIILDCDSYSGNLLLEAKGGAGGNNNRATTAREGPGGGGGGGVVWLSTGSVPSGVTVNVSGGINGVNINNNGPDAYGAAPGEAGAVLFRYYLNKGEPLTGNTFVVGPENSLPKPDFTSLAVAAKAFSAFGNDDDTFTIIVRDGNYDAPVIFERLNDGCVTNLGSVLVKSESGNRANVVIGNLTNIATVINHGGLTLKDLSISAGSTTGTAMQVISGANLTLDNVAFTGNLVSVSGSNNITIKNSDISGNVEISNGATLNINGVVHLNGQAVNNRSLLLANGSTFNQPNDARLVLNGANWTNNGATINLGANTAIQFSGNVAMNIGGAAGTAFRRLLVSNTATISATNAFSTNKWLQTSAGILNTGNHVVTVTDSLLTANGFVTSTGAGKIVLSGTGSNPAFVQGTFHTLDLSNANGIQLLGDVNIAYAVNLQNGIVHTGAHLFNINVAAPSALSYATGTWFNGSLRRNVSPALYDFPVGTATELQLLQINISSISGGLQQLTAKFNAQNPISHPVASTFNQQLEGMSLYTGLLPQGYWSLNPNAGSADYELRLFPTFSSPFAPFTIYKRASNTTVWDLQGTLSNPESTADYVQSDGSLRRVGFSGFSDFAIAESDGAPLPLRFLSFGARKGAQGIKLSWRMAECIADQHFEIWKGNHPERLQKTNLSFYNETFCNDFFTDDPDVKQAEVYYQVKGESPTEGVAYSQIVRVSNAIEHQHSLVPVSKGVYRFANTNQTIVKIKITDISGKVIEQLQVTDGEWIDLSARPTGVFFATMNDGTKTIFQKLHNF